MAKRIKAFRYSASIQKTHVFCARVAHEKRYRNDRMDWNINSLRLLKELDTDECEFIILNPNGTDVAELYQ